MKEKKNMKLNSTSHTLLLLAFIGLTSLANAQSWNACTSPCMKCIGYPPFKDADNDSSEIKAGCTACYRKTVKPNKYGIGVCVNFYFPHRQEPYPVPSIYIHPMIATTNETPLDCGVGKILGLTEYGKVKCRYMNDDMPSEATRAVSTEFSKGEPKIIECKNSVPSLDRADCVVLRAREVIKGCKLYARNINTGKIYCSKCEAGMISRGSTCVKSPILGCLVDSAFIPENFLENETEVIKFINSFKSNIIYHSDEGRLFKKKHETNERLLQSPTPPISTKCLRCDITNGYFMSDKNKCLDVRYG